MSRYIDANKLIERLRHNPDFLTAPKHSKDGIIDEIVYQPTADVVEVVRCKDCKHFTKGMAIGMCKRIEEKPIIPCRFDNYCMFGERSENGKS